MAYIGPKDEYSILYGGGSSKRIQELRAGQTGYVLSSGGTTAPPSWIANKPGVSHARKKQIVNSTAPTANPTDLDISQKYTMYSIDTRIGTGHTSTWLAKVRLPPSNHYDEGDMVIVKLNSPANMPLLRVYAQSGGGLDGSSSVLFASNFQTYGFVFTGTPEDWEVI